MKRSGVTKSRSAVLLIAVTALAVGTAYGQAGRGGRRPGGAVQPPGGGGAGNTDTGDDSGDRPNLQGAQPGSGGPASGSGGRGDSNEEMRRRMQGPQGGGNPGSGIQGRGGMQRGGGNDESRRRVQASGPEGSGIQGRGRDRNSVSAATPDGGQSSADPEKEKKTDGIKWRATLQEALSDARAASKPVLADFFAEWCGPCKQLDKTTFQDSDVIAYINSTFIPVKIDVDKNQSIAKEYHIDAMPSAVVMRPDGAAQDKFVGYLDGPSYLKGLKDIVKKAGDGAFAAVAKSKKHLEDAEKASASGKYSVALGMLKDLLKKFPDSPEAKLAKDKIKEIEAMASSKLAETKSAAEKRQFGDVAKNLKELQDVFAGTQASREAQELENTLANSKDAKQGLREAAAKQMLDQAVEDLKAQRYALALDRFKSVERQFADAPKVADEAKWNLDQMHRDLTIMRKARDEVAAGQAKIWLSKARSWKSNLRSKKAAEFYQMVIDTFPGTTFAEQAEEEMRARSF